MQKPLVRPRLPWILPRWAGLAGWSLVMLPATAAAQAVLRGQIRLPDSAATPVAGVEVVTDDGVRTVSGPDGRFHLVGLPLGVSFTTLRRIGFRPVRLRTVVAGADTVDVAIRMHPAAVELEPLRVAARAVPRRMQAYADRRLAGFGSFLDPDVLRENETRRLGDLLRMVRGVRLIPLAGSGRMAVVSSRTGCLMTVWLDGMRIFSPHSSAPPPDINEIAVSDLEAVEIYRGSAETPVELGGPGAACGVIALWTRRGG